MNVADRLMSQAIEAAEAGWIPTPALRLGIREICRRRLKTVSSGPEQLAEDIERFRRRQYSSPIAVHTGDANEQHYEVPAAFFELVLGPARKYSCCYFPREGMPLEQAEQVALAQTANHADLQDGQSILELGCGWGSLSLWMARRLPNSRIVAISNSSSQREYIMAQAKDLPNLEVVTADVNAFAPSETFDRVVSVEMFEHVRNHRELLRRIATWLRPDGRLLVHVFCSQGTPYEFEDEGADDWMARNFFTGGVMPSDDWLLRCQEDLRVERQWRWSGLQYKWTADAWLENLTRNRRAIEEVLRRAGEPEPKRAYHRWRLFFLGCSELFGYDRGGRWWVSHYRFRK